MAKKKAIQEFLPGHEPAKNLKVHQAALHYAEKRDERIALNAEEKEAHDTLLFTMLEEGLTAYEYGDLKVHIDEKKKCKVSTKPESPKGEADEEA